jgi:hypothetical protein
MATMAGDLINWSLGETFKHVSRKTGWKPVAILVPLGTV